MDEEKSEEDKDSQGNPNEEEVGDDVKKDEAIKQLVFVVHKSVTRIVGSSATSGNTGNHRRSDSASSMSSSDSDVSSAASSASGFSEDGFHHDENEYEDTVITSAIASAIERGIDKEFLEELGKSVRDSSNQIARICQDHSEPFLESARKVYLTVAPEAAKLESQQKEANEILQTITGNDMSKSANLLEQYRRMNVRARTMLGMVHACLRVAVLLEKAKRNASLCRPQYALNAVEDARECLTAPISSLLMDENDENKTMNNTNKVSSSFRAMLANEIMVSRQKFLKTDANDSQSEGGSSKMSNPNSGNQIPDSAMSVGGLTLTLEETPFGTRAMEILPKIENEVMMNARRQFNKFILALRSEGENGKAGVCALRKCSHSTAKGGDGGLGLGGIGLGYEWRALNADNLISRVSQGKIARAARVGYYYERDHINELDRLNLVPEGVQRKAESFAAAFGWYRCWDENASLGVEVTEEQKKTAKAASKGSKFSTGGSKFSLGSVSRTAATHPTFGKTKKYPQWATLLTPTILFHDNETTKEEEEKLAAIPECIVPVLHAQIAYALLGRVDEFRQIYEQNRFSDMKIEGKTARSSLSSLTGDDVYHVTDRIFFAKTLPHLCVSVVGFCAVEAALEIGSSPIEDEVTMSVPESQIITKVSREKGIRYERTLVEELGSILRERAVNATLTELCRASILMGYLRSTLKIVHPSSPVRKNDRELLSIDVDIILNALKKTKEEQCKYTSKVVREERYIPMKKSAAGISLASKNFNIYGKDNITNETNRNIVDAEVMNLPFGLAELVQSGNVHDTINSMDGDTYSFSHSVPHVIRSIHGRAIAFAAFCHSQQELGHFFPQKKGGGIAAYVLDTVEACIAITATSMLSGFRHWDELTVPQAVQIKVNLAALSKALPRLFGTLVRGLCHVGLVQSEQLDELFSYADMVLHKADKACEREIGGMYNMLFDMCVSKMDILMNFSLDNFNWVAKSFRDTSNTYTESLIEFMRKTFESLGPLDEGSRTGLHFSCCSHIAERLTNLLCEKVEPHIYNDTTKPEILKIDLYGLKNLNLDICAFEEYAENTGVKQLKDSFQEIKTLTSALIDAELPTLLQPENIKDRQKKYPVLSLEKLALVLDKYKDTGFKFTKTTTKKHGFLSMDGREKSSLMKLIRSQL